MLVLLFAVVMIVLAVAAVLIGVVKWVRSIQTQPPVRRRVRR
jgi:hypothetical protein